MRTLVLPAIAGCVVCVISISLAQTQGDAAEDLATSNTVIVSPAPPATKLQKFEVAKEHVVFKGYTEVGHISGERNSLIRVIAARLIDDNGAQEHGVILVIASSRGADVTATSYIDYDELEGLIKATDALQKADKNLTQLADFEARYRSRGDLELANLNIDGSRMIAVKSNQIAIPSGRYTSATAYFRAARLTEIREQLIAARAMLDVINP